MATLLTYNNGLLVPALTEKVQPVEIKHKSGSKNAMTPKKIFNILIVVTVTINALLTIAVAHNLS